MLNQKLTLFFTAFLLVTAVSCATIFKGSDAEVRFNSSPSDAEILVNDISRGTTPATLNLQRDEDHVITFQKDGYQDVQLEVQKDFDLGTTVIGNLFSWGIVGFVVDMATGAAYSLEPADLQANLEQMQAAGFIDRIPEQNTGEITVVMLTQDEWNQIIN